MRNYTWRPDLPDHRDHIYARALAALPESVDLRSHCSPVEDQGQLGSCTGNAWAGALELLEKKAGTPFFDVSRLWIYYQERALEGTVSKDDGAQIRDGAKAMAKLGYCTEALWPYSDNAKQFKKKPTAAAFKDALPRKITQYQRITDLQSMKTCLAEGYPFIFGFTVYDGFEGDEVARTGILNLPAPGEKQQGGHAVLCVGYDDITQRVLVRNSWGPDWGQGGYFWMPYAYIGNKHLADDMWTVRK